MIFKHMETGTVPAHKTRWEVEDDGHSDLTVRAGVDFLEIDINQTYRLAGKERYNVIRAGISLDAETRDRLLQFLLTDKQRRTSKAA